jgi:mannose-1-phosphate guanylyltransferase
VPLSSTATLKLGTRDLAMPPRKAIVLAAGFGSRLNPVTLDVPKPLLPCRGERMIVRVLQTLSSWGVRDVCINLHHRADRMLQDLAGLSIKDLRIQYSFEPVILGTGGPLRRMEGFIGGDPFWLCNADICMDLDPKPILARFQQRNPLAALWMVADAGPKTVRVEQGKVVDFRGGGQTFSGLHLISPRILRYVPTEESFVSIIDVYRQAMQQGEEIAALDIPGSHWADVGTPEQLIAENGGSVVLPGARVDAGAILDRAIVGEGARVRKGRRVQGMVVSPTRGLSPDEHKQLPKAEAVEYMSARGSDRDFRRIHLPQRTVILMRRGDVRMENVRFTANTRFLARKGLPVPEILFHSRDHRFWILEDLGRVHLLDRLHSGSPARNAQDTRQALEITARLHAIRSAGGLSLEKEFRPQLYSWEHDLFLRSFLARWDAGTDPETLRPAMRKASAALNKAPKVLLHRDLQSTNFMVSRRGFVLIDYQGMRLGPAAYDLASFLADPYVERSPEEQFAYLAAYNDLARSPVSEALYRFAAVQRLLQALGAYGRLGALPGTERFLEHVPPALRQLRALSPFPVLTDWAESFLLRNPDFPQTPSP